MGYDSKKFIEYCKHFIILKNMIKSGEDYIEDYNKEIIHL